MKRLLRLAARLYPSAWRSRYGDEFAALLDDVDARWRDVLNVLTGALTMQIRNFGVIPAALTLAGAIAGFAAAATMPQLYRSSVTLRLSGADPMITRSLLESAFGHDTSSRVNVPPSRIEVLVNDSRGAAAAGTRTLYMATLDPDPRQAQRATQRLLDGLDKATASLTTSNPPIRLETIVAPNLPNAAVSPNRIALAGTGGGIGLLLGGLTAWLRRRIRA